RRHDGCTDAAPASRTAGLRVPGVPVSQSLCPHYRVEDGVAVISLSQPPVNPLSHPVRRAIVDGVDRAQGDAAVHSIVIVGAGSNFSAGADMREFGTPAATQEPTLSTVLRILDDTS